MFVSFGSMDAIFAATEARPAAPSFRIVSEEHNTGNIRIEESAIRSAINARSGAWDASEYGISAERAAQMLAEADTPEARERVRADLRRRAIARANLDTTGGRVAVMVAGAPAWHGLGVNVDRAVTAADALQLAGLAWRVEKQALQYVNPVTGAVVTVDDKFAVVRMDTGEALGTVGRVYRPFQNAEAFEFLDDVIGEYGAHYETAGALFGGSRVWMQLRLPDQQFALNGSDEVIPYVLFTNSHDGTTAAQCFTTAHRVVCQNTLRLAGASAAGNKFHIRHSTNLKAKVRAARESLGIAVRQAAEFKSEAEALSRTKLEPRAYFDAVLDAVCEVTAADAIKGADMVESVLRATEAERALERARVQREIDNRAALMEDILSRYDSPTNGIAGIRGTAWAALNAVTESTNHGKAGGRFTGAENDRRSRRFDSITNGRANEINQVAVETVRAMAF